MITSSTALSVYTFMPIVVLIFAVPLILSSILIWRGVRGYREGNHPICRRCGFDLFGLPAETTVCGECGRSIVKPGSVRIGHHHRRGLSLWAGIIIMLPCLLSLFIGGYAMLRGDNWLIYAPVFLLDHNALSSDSAVRQPALAELTARMKTDLLTPGQRWNIIKTGLKYQADLSKPWDNGWGDLLEGFHVRGTMPSPQWSTYLSQCVAGTLRVETRPRFALGECFAYQVLGAPPRVGTHTSLQCALDNRGLVWPGHPQVNPVNEYGAWSLSYGVAAYGVRPVVPTEIPSDLRPGVVPVHFVADLKLGPPGNSQWSIVPDWSGKIDLPTTVQVLPAGQSTVKLIHKPELADAIRESLFVTVEHTPRRNSMTVHVRHPPVGLAFDVFVRSGSAVCHPMSFACVPWGEREYDAYDLKIPIGDHVDVILISNPQAVAATLEAVEAWDGKIVIKDWPVLGVTRK